MIILLYHGLHHPCQKIPIYLVGSITKPKKKQTLRLLHFRLSVLCFVALSPCPHGIQNGFQTFSKLGQTVLHPGRDLGIHFPADQSFFLHIPELCRQYFLGHTADGLLQLSEPLGPRLRSRKIRTFHLSPMTSAWSPPDRQAILSLAAWYHTFQ